MLDNNFFGSNNTTSEPIDGYLKVGYKADTKMHSSKTWLLDVQSNSLKQFVSDTYSVLDIGDEKKCYINLGREEITFTTTSVYQGAETTDKNRNVTRKCNGKTITWPDSERGKPCDCANKSADERYKNSNYGICVPYVDMIGKVNAFDDFVIKYTNNKWFFNKQINQAITKKQATKFILKIVQRENKEGFIYNSVIFEVINDD